MKIVSQIVLMFLLIFVITACKSNDNNEGQPSHGQKDMILATTTSTQDSGLLDVLIPIFEEKYNINVKTIAVGTGQALAMGKQGEADALLTHAPTSEEELVETEEVINRKRVMYNDFIIIGPKADPARISGADINTALQRISENKATFVSRGDGSGTHKMELDLWEKARVDPSNESWYIETGQGMGSTLQLSAEREGYLLADRATYLAHANNFEHMSVLVEGTDELLNIYHVMQVNDKNHGLVNGEAGLLFVEFMVSNEAQEIIKDFGVEQYNQPLFFQYTE
ncbi:tungsten ABC transporter substrate-binding protein [Anaerobacillus arseniciselenatis]|uniref:Tungsten ABC transporter substrate-binding protein n=1 Tax=Anaerobacillus arseniciselenatis TaxID=85682 RepID=A0A1S2LQI1_9BACI|nr:substrate-binding domain-containing protein [Anaerobacillus arseniciselenatis]OIJ14646.1 tungsten ABC transporter substrate-binding protein [Anaerobacillus arseniciselenatis]